MCLVILQVLTIAPLFWGFFYLFNVRTVLHPVTDEAEFFLPHPMIGPATCWYALIAMGPIIAWLYGHDPSENTLLLSASLTIIADRFAIVPVASHQLSSGCVGGFLARIISEAAKWLVAAVIVSVIWIFLQIPWFPPVSVQLDVLDSLFLYGDRVTGASVLPPQFYYAALLIGALRVVMIASIPSEPWRVRARVTFAVILGYLAIAYFHSVLAHTSFAIGSWDSPVPGVVLGLLSRIAISMHIEAHEDLAADHVRAMRWQGGWNPPGKASVRNASRTRAPLLESRSPSVSSRRARNQSPAWANTDANDRSKPIEPFGWGGPWIWLVPPSDQWFGQDVTILS